MEENKPLTLADLGLTNDNPIETIRDEKDPSTEIEVVRKSEPAKEVKKFFDDPETKHDIPTPATPIGAVEYGKTIDLNKVPRKPKRDPVKETMGEFNDLMDKGIARTKDEMSAPDGRIADAKEQVVEVRYNVLMKRAKSSETLRKKIAHVNNLIDSDPNFDGISDFSRKKYILYAIAHDEDPEIDKEWFRKNKEEEVDTKPVRRFRSSADASKDIDKLVGNEPDVPGIREEEPVIDKTTKEETVPSEVKVRKGPAKLVEPEDEDDYFDSRSSSSSEAELLSSYDLEDKAVEPEEDSISDEDNRKEYVDSLVKALKLDNDNMDLSEFKISNKPVKLRNALDEARQRVVTEIWPLPYTGIPVEMTPIYGDELNNLDMDNIDVKNINGARKVLSTIYNHIVMRNKPSYEVWLKQTHATDLPNLYMAVYNACFKSTNYITYECSDPQCGYYFLDKKNIEDMIVYPEDKEDKKKLQERLDKIISRDSNTGCSYTTTPILINKRFAIGFTPVTLFSEYYEPAVLTDEFKERYSTILSIMKFIDKVYSVDVNKKTLYPIPFGSEEDLTKTTVRKVRALEAIFKTFNADEMAKVTAELVVINKKVSSDGVSYCIPESKCPKCGSTIDRQVASDSEVHKILFMRARLGIAVPFIQE